MAFPVPSHLPRKTASNDVTSKILSNIDSASIQSIDSSLATSWIAELDESIDLTKTSIRSRIQQDLPKFKQQLETSKSVQARLQHITTEVEVLNDAISNPQTGLAPKTLQTLKSHAALAQETADASVVTESLTHLLKFRQRYTSVISLVQYGKLPEAVAAFVDIDEVVASSPRALEKANIMKDLKRRVLSLKSRVEEQLLEALSRSLIIQPFQFTVQPQVQVRGTETTVTLGQILASLSSATLDDYLSTLRRDFVLHFVDHVLQQPYSIEIGGSSTRHSVSLIPSSPNTELRITRLQNLSSIFDFVAQHVFPVLPSSQAPIFLRSLCKPVVTSILNLYLTPLLPSSWGLLPPFLHLVRASVEFEAQYVSSLLDPGSQDHPVKDWSNGLSGHYERQRRTAILASSRELLAEKIDLNATFQVEVERPLVSSYPTAVNGVEEEGAWGFEEESSLNTSQTDSWGFDDTEPEPELQPEAEESVVTTPTTNGVPEDDEPNPDDAWGWNDEEPLPEDTLNEESPPSAEEEGPVDEAAWDDDPWADPPAEDIVSEPVAPLSPLPKVLTPKAATRLERLASKNKKGANGTTSERLPFSPPPALSLSEPNSAKTIAPSQNLEIPRSSKSTSQHRPSNLSLASPMETYRVTTKMKKIVRFVEDVVAESKQFAASNLFAEFSSGATAPPATTLIQAASSVMDLYQALYPVRFEQELSTVHGALQFSNDCLYLSDSVDKFEREASNNPQLKERLAECRNDLKVLGDSWFDEAVDRECLRNDRLMVDGTQRFTFTGDQDRYDECEEAINRVVRNIKDLARKIKPIPSKGKYYQAIGRLVDAALSRVLHDITALPDIPELESNRLSELCRIFNSLEGLFSEDPTQSSFVVAYVPSWLKFSYLSELLEATMADISYLFEQGALVDFEIDELVNLVRALFADTQLRTNTINKVLEGHPTPGAD